MGAEAVEKVLGPGALSEGAVKGVVRPPAPAGWRGWAEIAVVYACIEGALWSGPAARAVWSWSAAGLIVLFLLLARPRWRQLGIVGLGPLRAWWIPPAALAAAAAILWAAARAGTLHGLYGSSNVYFHSFGYAAWTVIQEFIAQSFFFLHFERLIGGRRAVFANGLLFSAAHWPNLVLVPVTLVGGWILTELFRRYRTIYVLAIAHTLIALSIAVAVPNHLQRHMRVGRGYVQYGRPTQR